MNSVSAISLAGLQSAAARLEASAQRVASGDTDLPTELVEQKMAELQVRRIPIVDAAGRCVGIISQADIALAASRNSTVTDREIALVVEQISQPNGRGAGSRDPNFGFDESGVAPQF